LFFPTQLLEQKFGLSNFSFLFISLIGFSNSIPQLAQLHLPSFLLLFPIIINMGGSDKSFVEMDFFGNLAV